METVDYLAKARKLMAKGARTTILVIMPLASIGSAAAATFDLPITNFSCGGNPSPSPCSGGAASLGVFNNIRGMKFFGDAGFSGGGISGGAALHFHTFGFTGGSVSGGVTLPVTYDFSILADTDNSRFLGAWTLTVSLFTTTTCLTSISNCSSISSDLASTTFDGTGTGHFDGAGSMTTNFAYEGGGLIAQAFWDFPNWDGIQNFEVSVPQNSVNIGGSAVPEPATIGLLGSALAALALTRFRNRRS